MPGTCAFCDIPGALARMSPRLSYTCLVVIETFVCLVLTFPKVDVITQYFPYCTLYNEMPGCENFSGYMAVYRFSFAYVVFFLTSSLIMVKTKTMSDIRVRLQEGFWTVKCLILAGLCILFVLVPSGEFDVVWMVVGMLGSIVFTVVQIFTVLRLTYTLSKHLLSRTEEGSHAACAILFLLTTMIFMTAIVGLCLIVYYYPMCNLNLVFIVGHTMSSIMACLWSLSPCVREINPHSALIPASFVCLFVVFQTWSTISSNPFENCNPYQSETISWMLNLFSLIIALLIITYTSSDWRRKKSTQITDVEDPPQVKTEGAEFDAKKPTLQSTIEPDKEETLAVSPNDDDPLMPFNWSLCHFVYACAILYMMMCITKWYRPNSQDYPSSSNYTGMWFRSVSAWVTVICFTVTFYRSST